MLWDLVSPHYLPGSLQWFLHKQTVRIAVCIPPEKKTFSYSTEHEKKQGMRAPVRVKYISEVTQGKPNILSFYFDFSELNKTGSFPVQSIFFPLPQALAALSLV